MTENDLLEGSSVAEIRGIAVRALAGGDDYSRMLLREQPRKRSSVSRGFASIRPGEGCERHDRPERANRRPWLMGGRSTDRRP